MPTTISLDPDTKEMLRELGHKGESYDDIVRRLIRKAGAKKLDERWNRILEDEDFVPFEEL